MLFLTGLMEIALFGIALPILVLGFLGMCFLGTASYKDDLLSFKTLLGVACFCAIAYMVDISWSSIFTWWTLMYILAWVLLGGLWFLFKWNKFVGRARSNADAALKTAKAKKPDMSAKEQNAFMLGYRPELDRNKERAIGWLLLWPFSMLAYIFGDLLHDFAEWVIDRLRGMAGRITKRHFGQFEAS